MKNITLNEISLCTDASVKGPFNESLEVQGISIDTRTIREGNLFIALKGKRFDGHDFVKTAIEKGACAVVVSTPIDDDSITQICVHDTSEALLAIAGYYRKKLSTTIVGITGSAGKTTTKDMLFCILSSKFNVTSTFKNFNNAIGLPLSVLSINPDHRVAVLEVGISKPGEMSVLSSVLHPDISIITNIGSAHIGNFSSKDELMKEKLRITEGMDEDATLITNSDDEYLGCRDNIPFKNVLYAGCSNNKANTIHAENIVQEADGLYFDVIDGNMCERVFIPIFGIHNVQNAMLAILCALKLGVTISEAKTALLNFSGNDIRNDIYSFNGISVIKDYYNSNPESMQAELNALMAFPTKGKRIAIVGQMAELGCVSEREHFNLGQKCKAVCDICFFAGENYEQFREGFDSDKCYAFPDKESLCTSLEAFVKTGNLIRGDVVLIKGSRSLKMESVFEQLKSLMNTWCGSSFTKRPASSSRMYIDITAIKRNVSKIAEAVGPDVEVMPVIKANAYGCGVDTVSSVFKNSKIVAVANGREAVTVKNIYPQSDVMILYQPCISDIDAIVENNLIVGACSMEFLEMLNQKAAENSCTIRVHISIDSGSGRLGVYPADCTEFAQKMLTFTNLKVEGLYTHFCCADSAKPDDIAFTKSQIIAFQNGATSFEQVYGSVKYKHTSSSGGIFMHKEARFNMVRPGYIMYGYYPSKDLKKYVELTPALKLSSQIVYIKNVPQGAPISYGRTFVTSRDSKIATVAIGYSSGLHRTMSNSGFLVVNGQKAPIVGTICMDMMMIDITDIQGDVNIGDEVFVFDNVNVTLDDVAAACNTIGYEIISHIEEKVERIELI